MPTETPVRSLSGNRFYRTLREKVSSLTSVDEADGFTKQLQSQGELTSEARNLIAMRVAEVS